MATITRFEDLEIWRMARHLNRSLFPYLEKMRKSQQFELCKQIDRSAGSIMDNISEGFDRGGNKEFIQFLYIAKASAAEFRSQLYRMLDRELINEIDFNKLSEDAKAIGARINAFINYLQKTDIRGQKFKKSDAATK